MTAKGENKMWRKSENSNSVKPDLIDKSSTTRVLVRKDFVLVPAVTEEGKEKPEHWEYSECEMTPSEFQIYIDAQSQIDYLAMMADVSIE